MREQARLQLLHRSQTPAGPSREVRAGAQVSDFLNLKPAILKATKWSLEIGTVLFQTQAYLFKVSYNMTTEQKTHAILALP